MIVLEGRHFVRNQRLVGADPQDVLFSGQRGGPVLVAEDSLKIVVVLLITPAITATGGPATKGG